jgi:6-pyruvoyl-tetrahydropterin synthase
MRESFVIRKLDHQSLNDVVENPTCERVLQWIAENLSTHLPQLLELVLWETATACAVFRIPGLEPVSLRRRDDSDR